VARDILDTLGIDPASYKTDHPIREWINAAESNGIFVSRGSFIHSKMKLHSDELQGFAIADKFAPFVFVNSDDWNSPQLFTLVHELAHIWIAATGISNSIEPEIVNRDKFSPTELFCNEVAANALIPSELILKVNKSIFKDSQEIFKVSKKLGVSPFAFLLRALNLELISNSEYSTLKARAVADFQAFLKREADKKIALKLKQKEKQGGPNPYLLRLNKNSRLFTQVVLDALKSGFVQPTQASFLLGTPSNNLHKLEAQIYK
jgi:Zn-dependent peptidase ImmA (M78 family)